MAKIPGAEVSSEPLTYQMLVLKVSIHCEGCMKKVKKALQSVNGVYTTMIDPQQHKVTVIGNVDAHIFFKKLLKIKKRAELWPQISDQKDEHSTKPNNNKKQNMRKDANLQDEQHVLENSDDNQSLEVDEEGCEGDEIFQLVGGGGGGGGGSSKKKKKKKGQNGNLTNGEGENGGYAPAGTGSDPLAEAVDPHMWLMNKSPPSQKGYAYQPSYYGTPVYGRSYNAVYTSSSFSYYDSAVYDHMQVGTFSYPLPPLAHPIKMCSDRDDDYDDDEIGCSII